MLASYNVPSIGVLNSYVQARDYKQGAVGAAQVPVVDRLVLRGDHSDGGRGVGEVCKKERARGVYDWGGRKGEGGVKGGHW
jgi:hypothetical protein